MNDDRPGFWDQFRDDPIIILGPVAALSLIVLLAMLLLQLGG